MPRPHSILRRTLPALGLALAAIGTPAAGADPAASLKVEQSPIPDDVWAAMQGVSWHASFPDCPSCACPPRDELLLLTIPYRDFDDTLRSGRMIVARAVADDVAAAMQTIFDSDDFRIQQIELVDAYGGSDDRSMAANNTSAFNCRAVTGGTQLSAHAYGTAIDINPVQNPYVKGRTTLPRAGTAYDEPDQRTAGVPGMILADGVVVSAFEAVGWTWGGDWTSLKDYQHFSADGR